MIFSIIHICHLSDCDEEFQTADHHMDTKKARSHYIVARAIERMSRLTSADGAAYYASGNGKICVVRCAS